MATEAAEAGLIHIAHNTISRGYMQSFNLLALNATARHLCHTSLRIVF